MANPHPAKSDYTIARAALVEIVDRAIRASGCAASTEEKLRAVAETTHAVAAGWFHCDGVQCPSRQARRPNQRFMTAYDHAMFAHFGRDLDGDGGPDPFVVEVLDG